MHKEHFTVHTAFYAKSTGFRDTQLKLANAGFTFQKKLKAKFVTMRKRHDSFRMQRKTLA